MKTLFGIIGTLLVLVGLILLFVTAPWYVSVGVAFTCSGFSFVAMADDANSRNG